MACVGWASAQGLWWLGPDVPARADPSTCSPVSDVSGCLVANQAPAFYTALWHFAPGKNDAKEVASVVGLLMTTAHAGVAAGIYLVVRVWARQSDCGEDDPRPETPSKVG